MKMILDYFKDDVDYPQQIAFSPIPEGVLWNYVSSTFLNGFINYVKPVACFVLDRYTRRDEPVSRQGFSTYPADKFLEWEPWVGTKQQLMDALISGTRGLVHTNLRCFNDDVVILAQAETPENTEGDCYVFFWFDCDVSDGMIGKFITNDPVSIVKKSVVNMLEHMKENCITDAVVPGCDNGVVDYTELPVSFIKGWVKF